MDFKVLLIVAVAFVSTAGVVFAGGELYVNRLQMKRRLQSGAASNLSVGKAPGGRLDLLVNRFSEDRFGVDNSLRQKLRRDLVRAGFFGNDAIRYYVFFRICSVIFFPIAIFAATQVFLPGMNVWIEFLLVGVAAVLGILGPDAYLSRRHSSLVEAYRLVFPDFLDLMIVCVSAGLSVEASMERVRTEMTKRSATFGLNLALMGAEMRAGRTTADALNSLADRLGLDEASSFVAVLRHSVELGGDIASSLRVFSDEMRLRRMMRAEQRANELPVKIVLPLGVGIFPVILEIVLLPVVMKLMVVFNTH